MSLPRQLILGIVLLAAVLALFEFTDIDLRVQDSLYLGHGNWRVEHQDDVLLNSIFYSGAKTVISVVGTLCGVACFISLVWRKRLAGWRRPLLMMSLSFVIVPSVLVGLREVTNVYGPYQLARYDKDQPYVKVFETYPKTFNGQPYRQHSRGKCFPAGHATGGFAMMMLFFVLRGPLLRWLGLAFALAAGWAMGLYQTCSGKHFLSHTVVTMIGAWILIVLIVMFVNRLLPATPMPQRPAADPSKP